MKKLLILSILALSAGQSKAISGEVVNGKPVCPSGYKFAGMMPRQHRLAGPNYSSSRVICQFQPTTG